MQASIMLDIDNDYEAGNPDFTSDVWKEMDLNGEAYLFGRVTSGENDLDDVIVWAVRLDADDNVLETHRITLSHIPASPTNGGARLYCNIDEAEITNANLNSGNPLRIHFSTGQFNLSKGPGERWVFGILDQGTGNAGKQFTIYAQALRGGGRSLDFTANTSLYDVSQEDFRDDDHYVDLPALPGFAAVSCTIAGNPTYAFDIDLWVALIDPSADLNNHLIYCDILRMREPEWPSGRQLQSGNTFMDGQWQTHRFIDGATTWHSKASNVVPFGFALPGQVWRLGFSSPGNFPTTDEDVTVHFRSVGASSGGAPVIIAPNMDVVGA